MTLFGASLITLMVTSFLGWTVLFSAIGRTIQGRQGILLLALVLVLLDTYIFAQMFITFGLEGRSWIMHGLQVIMVHITSIALGAIVWAIVGQRGLYAFLRAPLIFLIIALGLRLAALGLGLTFDPSI